jgi:hypothetical protein
MKYLFFLFLMLPAMAFAADAKPGNPGLEAIIKALSTGDADGLSKYFADKVEVSISGKEQNCTKAQATELMQVFFNTNKPKNFVQVHQGNSRDNSDQYCIGNLSLQNGSEYRVYLFIKGTGANTQIHEIRLDRA